MKVNKAYFSYLHQQFLEPSGWDQPHDFEILTCGCGCHPINMKQGIINTCFMSFTHLWLKSTGLKCHYFEVIGIFICKL